MASHIQDRINRIIEGWYIFENALFETVLSHSLRENNAMTCGMRCGKGLIEYNSTLLAKVSDEVLELMLKRECVRIILKHPYERQPMDCAPEARYAASNLIIADSYAMRLLGMPLSSDLGLPRGKSYEWYAHRLTGDMPDAMKAVLGFTSENVENAEIATSLWQEDPLQAAEIDIIIEKIRQTGGWGRLPGNLVQEVLANVKAKLDYRNVLAGFRASVLSSSRRLTRMRPNRRTGFASMGSLRKFNTRLLIGVDVSGSISDKDVRKFFSVVNLAFRYGIEQLDLVTFDTKINDILSFRKERQKVRVTGRGGTDFQPAIDYAGENGYDGIVILTDGCAPVPLIPAHARFKVAWVFDSKESYDSRQEKFRPTGRCFYID